MLPIRFSWSTFSLFVGKSLTGISAPSIMDIEIITSSVHFLVFSIIIMYPPIVYYCCRRWCTTLPPPDLVEEPSSSLLIHIFILTHEQFEEECFQTIQLVLHIFIVIIIILCIYRILAECECGGIDVFEMSADFVLLLTYELAYAFKNSIEWKKLTIRSHSPVDNNIVPSFWTFNHPYTLKPIKSIDSKPPPFFHSRLNFEITSVEGNSWWKPPPVLLVLLLTSLAPSR